MLKYDKEWMSYVLHHEQLSKKSEGTQSSSTCSIYSHSQITTEKLFNQPNQKNKRFNHKLYEFHPRRIPQLFRRFLRMRREPEVEPGLTLGEIFSVLSNCFMLYKGTDEKISAIAFSFSVATGNRRCLQMMRYDGNMFRKMLLSNPTSKETAVSNAQTLRFGDLGIDKLFVDMGLGWVWQNKHIDRTQVDKLTANQIAIYEKKLLDEHASRTQRSKKRVRFRIPRNE